MEYPYLQYMYSYPHKMAYQALHGIELKDYMGRLQGRQNSLYFHIPFCQSKCGYCNLFSLAGQPSSWMETYVDAMWQHARQLSGILPEGVRFSDLALGGGTPLILPETLLREVFAIARECFGIEAGCQDITAETSPNQTTSQKLGLLKEEGVSRISIGVQSFQEDELRSLYRLHTAVSAKQALDRICKTGFSCVNIDLIYGIPGQTERSLEDSLRQALEFEPEELFVYPLYVKPGTLLSEQGARQSKDAFGMYCFARDFLRSAGYRQDSMRRFVRSGKELPALTCGFGNTLSVGCGGRSYLGNLHFCTPYAVRQTQCRAILQEYIGQEDYLQVAHGFVLSEEEERRRYIIRHILFGRGILLEDYRQNFGGQAEEDFPQLEGWVTSGYARKEGGFLALTEEGLALSDFLGPQLMSEDVKRRMEHKGHWEG